MTTTGSDRKGRSRRPRSSIRVDADESRRALATLEELRVRRQRLATELGRGGRPSQEGRCQLVGHRRGVGRERPGGPEPLSAL